MILTTSYVGVTVKLPGGNHGSIHVHRTDNLVI